MNKLRVASVAFVAAGLVAWGTPIQAQEGQTCFLYAATIVGTEGDDVLTGTAESDVIVGLGGDDIIDGGEGEADRICGGAGNDEIFDPDGYRLRGDSGNDVITVGDPSPVGFASGTLVGDEGDDVLRTTQGIFGSYLRPGPGIDTIEAGGGADKLDYSTSATAVDVDLERGTTTGQGEDTLVDQIEAVVGSRHNDVIQGDGTATFLDGYNGNDVVIGREGPDNFILSRGRDRIRGGIGSDWVHVTIEHDRFTTTNLERGLSRNRFGQVTQLASIENVDGGARLIGDDVANQLNAGRFGDFIDGKRGDDILRPGGANDRVFAGKGDDLVTGCPGGNDRVQLGPGDDVIDVGGSECGQYPRIDTIDGGPGNDLASYAGLSVESWGPVTADLRRGACFRCDAEEKNSTLDRIEDLIGSDGNDELRGDGGANALSGGPGDDLLDGRGGRDELDGGDGTDDCRNGETQIRCE